MLKKVFILAMLMGVLSALSVPVYPQQSNQKQKSESVSAEEKARIAEQKRIIEELEQQVAADEKKLKSIKQDKSTAQQRVQSITKQINSRNQLLNRTENEISSIEKNIRQNDSLLVVTREKQQTESERLAEMVREAYRNYQQNNYVTYLLASESFTDAARRIANIKAVAELRAKRIERIDSLNAVIANQQSSLAERRQNLDAVQRKAEEQRKKLQSDVKSAQKAMNQLSTKEKAALREKMENEQRLDAAIDALRKLTKGNTAGASFSRTTSNLNLPVEGGTVRKYKGNMAEIVGAKGATVRSIYEGKVVEIKRNRITNKYDVFVAHGEYITSYANLETVSVQKEQKVAKNGRLGEIGSAVNVTTMQPEYKMVFGIYSPKASEVMRAADCFKKK
ncbi:MAG: peptidoglycan DD-metalloendopeptidase family protein [Alistipes sp.]|nr:peptidoglycan DD-metalloendopeptidase family protein [Alistipes sp.]